MRLKYSTAEATLPERKRVWTDAIARTYFPLELGFRDARPAFRGELDVWSLGAVSISHHTSDGTIYRRHERHLLHEREESFLVTVPEQSAVSFRQDGRDVRCRPGSFLIERSHLPYEFSYAEANTLWVLKVPSAVLRARISRPERLATLSFDALRGAGGLFVDMIRNAAARLDELTPAAREVAGRHLVDLLALAVEADERVLGSGSSTVRKAHLQRIEQYLRAHLTQPALSPGSVAEACGVSLRYLHDIFEDTGESVSGWIRDQRLLLCREALNDPTDRRAIGEIAYATGYRDQAQFSRHYRARFGHTPSDARAGARSLPA